MTAAKFYFPHEELCRELDLSQRKVLVMESALADVLEELRFLHRQAEQITIPAGLPVSRGLQDLVEELQFTKRQLDVLHGSLEEASQQANQRDAGQQLRERLVKLMNLALRHWEEATGTTKLELAEESGIWKLHQDKGYLRVRTLDRYLSVPTLPKQPRWRDVTRTVRFVLSKGSSSVVEELLRNLQEFQRLLLRSPT